MGLYGMDIIELILNSKLTGLFGMDCRAGGFWCVGRRCLGPKSWHLNWQICDDSGHGCSWHTTQGPGSSVPKTKKQLQQEEWWVQQQECTRA